MLSQLSCNVQLSKMKLLYPLVSADIALFSLVDGRLAVLLGRRENAPERNHWALPGGVLDPEVDASLEETARRVLKSKLCVDVPVLEQVLTVSGPDRDPRGYSVSTLFYALLPSDQVHALAGAKMNAVAWMAVDSLPPKLAFDHGKLLEAAITALRDKVERRVLPLHLLAAKFTLSEVQSACEAILGREVDKASFRRILKDDPSLVELPGEFHRGPQRPAQLYTRAKSFAFNFSGR